MKIGKAERLECPAEFQQWLTDIFGVNRFGEPLFKVAWGQTETIEYAMERGYAQKLIGHNKPCWMIMRWRPPEIFGTPEIYYRLNMDEETGLAIMGEYPDFGVYEPIVMLKSERFDPVAQEMIVETLPLDWDLIEKLVPMLEAAERLTPAEIAAAEEAIKAQENAEIVAEIADRMDSALPSFYGPTSHAASLNKTALIDRRKQQIEHEWKRQGKIDPKRGLFQEQI